MIISATFPAGVEPTDNSLLREGLAIGYASSLLKSHRIALGPTADQALQFGQHAGYARFAYNWALDEFRAGLEVGERVSERTLRPRWNRVKGMIAPWGTELSQNAAKYAIFGLQIARDALARSWPVQAHLVEVANVVERRSNLVSNEKQMFGKGG